VKGYGVRRLVVINSGSYRFADVSLEGPIHLVAPNNRGKSTLVNALQFLYIDDFRHMRFPKSPEETRDHYFGNSVSYLVFECATATGPQSLLVVGRGKMNSSVFSRFVFAGGYQPQDFQDDEGRVVPFDVLRTRLADRSLIEVRPAELWEVLGTPTRRAHPERNGHPIARLGLLPIKTKEDYRSFRETYVRLLSLSDANAAELRRLLISCHATHVSEVKLDVAAEYKEEFDRADRSDNRLAFLKAAQALIDDGERLRAEVESHAALLRTAAPTTVTEAARLRGLLVAANRELEKQAGEFAADQRALADERSTLDRAMGSTEREHEQVATALADLDALHARWSACTPQMLQAIRDNADALLERIARMRDDLRQAGEFNLAALRRSAEALQRDANVQERSLANWERRVSAWLLAQGLTPDELVAVFRLVNPSLLHLLVGEDVEVTDGAAIVGRLRAIAGGVAGDTYSDSDVSIHLTRVGAPAADDLRDPETARHSLAVARRQLEEALQGLKVAEDVGRARLELKKHEDDYARAQTRLADHDQYLARWESRPDLQSQLDALKKKLGEANAALGELASRNQLLNVKALKVTNDRVTVEDLSRKLENAIQKVQLALDSAQIVFDNATSDVEVTQAPPLEQLRQLAGTCIQRVDEVAARVQAVRLLRVKLKGVQTQIVAISEEHPGQRVYFSDEDAEWGDLIDGRHAVAELEQTTSQNWETLFTTITAKLDGLVQGVRAISAAAGRINTAMKRHRVSNLREVQLNVERQHDACDLLESLTRPDGLFTDPEALGRAKDQLRRWIKDGKVIQLDDLFAVRIRVQGTDGTWTDARSLDDIGSTGTRMTAKAMIFIQLVRAVVNDERFRLHFYLDETGQLDDYNLHAITQMASERGIVPITAEPRIRIEPLAHPIVTVYALGQGADSKFGIDSKKTIRAARRALAPEGAERVSEPA